MSRGRANGRRTNADDDCDYWGIEAVGHAGELGPDEWTDEDYEIERAIDAARRAGGIDIDRAVGFGRPSAKRRR